MTDEASVDVEVARLEIERERLRLEQARLRIENKFWNKNTGTVITAMISLVAIVVSLSQVWAVKITKDKELQMTAIQKQSELTLLQEQRNREWNLSAAKFVTENRKAIFGGDQREQELFARLIPTIFPKDVSDSLLEKLIATSTGAAQETWKKGYHVSVTYRISPSLR
jgi:hypothetical protein